MKLKIAHTTKYTYDAPVSYGLQQVRLTPVSSKHQTVLDWDVSVMGGSKELQFQDQHENETLLLQVDPGATEVVVAVNGEVETHCSDGIYGALYGKAPIWHFGQSTARTTAGRGITKLAKSISGADNSLNAMHDLSKAVLTAVPYAKTATFAGTTAEEALAAGGGVCQDHAQIFISAARMAGFPARYVSGYLMLNESIDQDASHAWAEVYVDDLGWVGFDVSNGISPDERYVRVATGLDSRDAAPITGLRLGSSVESMIVSLQIQQ